MLKIPLSLALKNPSKKTVFDVELWMTQNRRFAWSVFVSEQKRKKKNLCQWPPGADCSFTSL